MGLLAVFARPGSAVGGDWRIGPGVAVSSDANDFRLSLTGYIQGDFRSFRNWDAGDEDTGTLRNDSREVRRLRLGVEAKWRALSAQFQVDPRKDEPTRLKDLFADVRLVKALRVRGGHFKLPISREFLGSAAKTDFVERTLLASNLAPQRDWGVMAHGEIEGRLAYEAGLFKGDGRRAHWRAGRTLAARVVVQPFDVVDLGGSVTHAEVAANPEGPGLTPKAKGLSGTAASGFEFFGPRFVNGTRRRWGLEAAVSPGPTSLKAEFLRAKEVRKRQGATFDDLPEVVATGWSVSATSLLTGEKKNRTIKPKRPFPRGPGAIEIGLRYESLGFDDEGPDTGFSGVGNRARNIRPAGDRVFTGGLSWWPVGWVRFMGNMIVERFKDPLLAPEPGRRGNYVTLLGRIQVQAP